MIKVTIYVDTENLQLIGKGLEAIGWSKKTRPYFAHHKITVPMHWVFIDEDWEGLYEIYPER